MDRRRDSSVETIKMGRQQALGCHVLTYEGPRNLELRGLEAGREGGR